MLSSAPCCTVAGIYYVEYGAFGDGGVGVDRGREGLNRPAGWRDGYSGLLGGTLSTRTEIAGGSLPSDPVLISPHIPRLSPPLSHASIPACLPSPLSLSHPCLLSLRHPRSLCPSMLHFSRNYYANRISHCIILRLTRDVSHGVARVP